MISSTEKIKTNDYRAKLTMLNMLHSEILSTDEYADLIIRLLDTGDEDDRIVYEVLTRIRVAIGPFIDGLAELPVYGRSWGG